MALVVDTLSKRFGDIQALDGITFAAEAGQVFGFLGANGAGKTTTMRIVLDILHPDSGSVAWNDRPAASAPRRTWGYLPEERGLYPRMKVLDQLVFVGSLYGIPRAEAARRARRWLTRFRIADYAERRAEELSKGNEQKIQFIAAILHDPDVLLMDEPFSGLDPINVALMRDYFLEFRQRGKTIVFCTHVLEQAEKLCDEITLMARSRKILEGSIKELKQRYSQDLLRISMDASLEEVRALPGVATAKAFDGTFVVSLTSGVDRREFLRRTLERYRIDAFSQKEPELEEIYLDAVKSAGIEDRIIE